MAQYELNRKLSNISNFKQKINKYINKFNKKHVF